jgi:hypothetical protein
MPDITIPDEQIAASIRDALTTLVTRDSCSRFSRSPLQTIASSVIEAKARDILLEMIVPGSELHSKITDLIKDATMEAFNGGARARMVESIASSIGRAFEQD